MSNEPILFDPEQPLAHYERARKLYATVKKRLAFGTVMPLISFFLGAACIGYDPWLMAIFALFAIPFTLLSIIGCRTRRAKLCLIGIPMAFILSLVTLMSGEFFAPLSFAAYVAAAFAEIMAIPAANDFYKLKELPGFPFFDASMDNISFAAMDRHGADEFIDESSIHEELEVKKYVPIEPPSQEMSEIITDGIELFTDDKPQLSEYEYEAAKAVSDVPDDLKDEVIMSLGHLAPNLAEYEEAAEEERLENADRPFERMINAQVKNDSKLSDVELFG